MALRKTIFVPALSLILSLPALAASGGAAPASHDIDTTTVNVAEPDTTVNRDAARNTDADRDAETDSSAGVDCFYQENANDPDCSKSSKASSARSGY